MISYSKTPSHKINVGEYSIASFIAKNEDQNIDWKTVDSFGSEWEKFDSFSDEEIEKIGDDYFDIVPKMLFEKAIVLDVGCGSGRWSKYLSDKVSQIEAIDPSEAVVSAHKMLKNDNNVRITQASVESIPFEDGTFDIVISLGVLHHIPDTEKALQCCTAKVKKGGACLIYLYYNLDNRGFAYKVIFHISGLVRRIISNFPSTIKKVVCDLIAFLIYWPLSRFSRVVKTFLGHKTASQIPLFYYRDKSLTILKNDALDRFGTPLEQRFTKEEMMEMMERSGLEKISFSNKAPYWHAIGYKK